MFSLGVGMWAGKLAAIWSGGTAGLIADISVFSPNSLFGALGAMIIIVGTAVLTVRSNAIRFWKDEAEAARARLERTELERDEQRALKHEVKAELAAEKKLRDLTPILQQLAENQNDDALLIQTVDKLVAALEANTSLLHKVADFIENERRRT